MMTQAVADLLGRDAEITFFFVLGMAAPRDDQPRRIMGVNLEEAPAASNRRCWVGTAIVALLR